MKSRLVGAIAAMVLLLGGSAAALAQPAAKPGQPAAARTATTSTTAHKPPKPAPAARRVAAPIDTGEPGQLSDYWTIERALPGRTREDRGRPAATTSELGRVPLQNAPGTLGIASGNIRGTEFSDGRPVPGLTQNTRGESSYVGLSLSVPSSNNSFPIPAPPSPWGPPQ
jgi:hypothetical protein